MYAYKLSRGFGDGQIMESVLDSHLFSVSVKIEDNLEELKDFNKENVL